MKRQADIEGTFQLFANSGRTGSVCSGYRPGHKIHENYISSGEHQYIDSEWVSLGGSASTKLWLVTPEAYPASIWVGRELEVSEGTHIVGKFTVTSVFNETLLCTPDGYNPIWVVPPELDN
jgi:hypothetical protein